MKPVKILIIDDEPAVCKGCAMALTDENHVVRVCMTGREGTELIREGDYDLVLLDMKLHDIEGMEILRTTRETKL